MEHLTKLPDGQGEKVNKNEEIKCFCGCGKWSSK